MAERIELPPMLQGDENTQIQQIWSYLYQMSEAINNNLTAIGGNELTDSERQVMNKVLGEAKEVGDYAAAAGEMETLKSLIIKTADFVQTNLQEYRMSLLGEAVASGQFGRYVRHTGLDVEVTPEGIMQNYSFEEVVQGLKEFAVNAKNYIKTGLLRTVGSIPVYGVAIGKDIVTFSEDGTETYHDGNKVAELTADELSFWQNGAKIGSYTGERISFYYGATEAFYIYKGKIYCNGDLNIESGADLNIKSGADLNVKSGGKMTVESGGGLDIASGGNVNVKSGGKTTVESGGNLDVASGGNVNLKSGGKLTVESGGDLDIASGGNTNIKSGANLNVKSGGKLSVENGGDIDVINGGDINVLNGGGIEIQSGADISIKTGGTFTLQSGKFSIDQNGDAFFAGDLNAAGGTFTGSLETINWIFNNLGALYTNNDPDHPFKMWLGPDTNLDYLNNGGLFFRNETKYIEGIRKQYGKIYLVARDQDKSYQGQVVLSCDSPSTGSFWPNSDRAHSVSLGNYTNPWINAWQTNINAPAQLRIYPRTTQIPPSSGQSVAYGSFVFEKNQAGDTVMMIPGGGTGYSYQIGSNTERFDNGYFININSRNAVNVDSSIEYKHDVQEIGKNGDRIDKLRPVSYIHNDDKKNQRQYGLIWEEAVEVFPEICAEEDGHRGIRYSGLIPVLLKEIQELRARVKALEERG